jgi:hypothetical protein
MEKKKLRVKIINTKATPEDEMVEAKATAELHKTDPTEEEAKAIIEKNLLSQERSGSD